MELFQTSILDEQFTGATLDPRLRWLNPPSAWEVDPGQHALTVESGANTDFWQRTHYGFSVDNGHFLGLELDGDFSVSTQVRFYPVHQYDQAGLMIRVDRDHWLKASVEHELEGPSQLGAVVTNLGFSDWSLQDMPLANREVRLRLCLRGGDLTAEWGAPGDMAWRLMRVAHMHVPVGTACLAGLYACSPKGARFRAEFTHLRVDRL